MPRRRALFAIPLLAVWIGASGIGTAASGKLPARLTDQEFWSLIDDISEPSGTFRSDNLLSNEGRFQYVIPELVEAAKPGLQTPLDVVTLAATLETVATHTYLNNLSLLNDSDTAALFGSVQGVECQHLATLRAVGATAVVARRSRSGDNEREPKARMGSSLRIAS